MTAPGYFIVVEGPEGAGKSTLVAGLAERIKRLGLDAVVVREPGGTPAAETIRRVLLDPAVPIQPLAELFLFLAARADLVEGVIRPALAQGRVVLADRFQLSTEAYQISGRGLERSVVLAANAAATGGLVPDCTLVVDVPSHDGLDRARSRKEGADRMEQENAAFHQRVAQAFARATGAGVSHLDGMMAPARVLDQAFEVLRRQNPETFGAT
ncbi:MAG: dTMP kinase [Gemmatimonadota bacterium]